MPLIDQSNLLNHVRTFAERKLREMLEAEFGENLKERKAIIRQEVRETLVANAKAQRNAMSVSASPPTAHLGSHECSYKWLCRSTTILIGSRERMKRRPRRKV